MTVLDITDFRHKEVTDLISISIRNQKRSYNIILTLY